MEPEVQVYTTLFWPEIKVKNISDNIYEYSLEEKRYFFLSEKKII